MRWSVPALLLLAACLPEPTPTQDCKQRRAYYPDDDGDGEGEPTAVYIGCEPPEGWVDNVGEDLSTEDTGPFIEDTATDSGFWDSGFGSGLWWTGGTGWWTGGTGWWTGGSGYYVWTGDTYGTADTGATDESGNAHTSPTGQDSDTQSASADSGD